MAGFISRFWSGFSAAREQKTAVPQPYSAQQISGAYGLFLTPQEVTPFEAWLLYKNVAPLAKVIDLIADQVASLVPLVKIDGKIVRDTEIHAFLNRPGFNRTRRRFIKELAVQYLVSGTAYTHVIGNVAHGPVAMDILKSKMVAITPGADMWPQHYMFSEGTRSIRFDRDQNARDPRWVDPSQMGEIVPIYDMDGDRRGVGLSRINAIKSDVQLRAEGIQHNASVIQNGAKIGGVLSFKEELTPEQIEDVRSQMNARHAGPQNAGKIMVTQGGASDFQALNQTMKDMDFSNLVKHVEDAMVSRYNVPVTLFRTEAQTNNNYETAWNMFYDVSVLPTFEILYAGLAQILSERLGVQIELEHDALTSPVLARQASARARELFNSRMISRNEARKEIGYEPVLGGDSIYGPMGEVPVAEDFFTDRGEGADMTAEGFHQNRNTKLPDGAPAQPQAGNGNDDGGEDDKAPPKKPAAVGKKLWLVA
jgi:HK97 family phage portal protein